MCVKILRRRSSSTRANNLLCRGCSRRKFSVAISLSVFCSGAISREPDNTFDALDNKPLEPSAPGGESDPFAEILGTEGGLVLLVDVPVDPMILFDNPFRSDKNHSNRRLKPGNFSSVSGSMTRTANNGISPTRDLMGRASFHGPPQLIAS